MSLKTFFYLIQLLWLSTRGARKVKKIVKEYSNDIVFLAFSGIGDICYSFAFLDELKKKYDRNVVVFTRRYTERLVSKYSGIDDIVVVNERDSKLIRKFLERPGRNATLLNDGTNERLVYSCNQWKTFNYSIMNLAKDFVEVQKIVVYNLDDSSRLTYPIPVANKGYNDYSNSVILNPFSNYVNNDCMSIFEAIAKHFLDEGLDVYTNMVSGKSAVKGTKELICEIDDLYNITRTTKMFVSVRSGILDYMVSNGGNYFVLYPDLWGGLFYKAYTLHAWKTESHIAEIIISADCTVKDRVLPELTAFEDILK